jgi:hypothetical protein
MVTFIAELTKLLLTYARAFYLFGTQTTVSFRRIQGISWSAPISSVNGSMVLGSRQKQKVVPLPLRFTEIMLFIQIPEDGNEAIDQPVL